MTPSSLPQLSPVLRFALGTAGCFYVVMTFSLVVHECVGHGVANLLLGGEFLAFRVDAGFSGSATITVVDSHRWLVTWGGIFVNALVGGAAIALAFRRRELSAAGYPLFWVGVTQSGHAVVYALQGLLFGRGDARGLHHLLGVAPRILVGIGLGALFAGVVAFALRGFARALEQHFRPRSKGERRWAAFLGLALPVGLVVMVAATRGPLLAWQRHATDAVAVLILAAGSFWLGSRAPRGGGGGRPLGWGFALSWLGAAVVLAVLALTWLRHGVSL